jgi:hypothetical protein
MQSIMSSEKRAEVSRKCHLDDVVILLHVLNMLGPGHHLFISAVSKAWKESYETVASVQMAGLTDDYDAAATNWRITHETTLFSAVFESASRVRLAYQSGMRTEGQNGHLQQIAGRVADVVALRVAHGLGLDLRGFAETTLGAAEAASMPTLQYLHTELGCPLHADTTFYAARFNSMEMLNWLKEHGVAFTASACRGAAAGGQVHLLQFLRKQRCRCDDTTCRAAGKHGQLPALRYLHEQGFFWQAASICGDAAESGSIETLLYLREEGCHYSADTLTAAAMRGQLAVCQFLVGEHCPRDAGACAAAARGGHLEIVRFLQDSGCPWHPVTICIGAAESGNLELLHHLGQQGGVFCERAMRAAAARGYTHICQYLRAEVCPWDTSACSSAASGGHISTLRWLHEHGCPWDAQSLRRSAAQLGYLPALAYVLDAEPVSKAELTELLNCAGALRQLAVARWLRQQGAGWPAVLGIDNLPWQAGVLQWARAEGCTAPVWTDV